MNKNIKTVLGLIIAVLVVWGIYSITQKSSEPTITEPIKIGVITAMTEGGGSNLAIHFRQGIELAAKELNDKGVNFEFIYEDNGMNPTKAVSAFKKLVNVDNVDMVLTAYSFTSMPLIPLAEENSIPLLGSIITAEDFANSDYTIKFFPSTKSWLDIVANRIPKDNIKHIALLNMNDDFGQTVKKYFNNNCQEQIVIDEMFLRDNHDFRTQLLKIKNTDADVLVVSGLTSHILQMLQQKKELGLEMPVYDTSINLSDLNVISEAGDYVEGHNLNAFAVDVLDNNNIKLFKEKFYKQFEIEAIGISAIGYDLIMAINQTIKGEKMSGEEFINKMRKEKFSGINGEFSIDSDDNVRVDLYSAKILNKSLILVE